MIKHALMNDFEEGMSYADFSFKEVPAESREIPFSVYDEVGIKFDKDSFVVDVGCGGGSLEKHISKTCHKMLGIDIAKVIGSEDLQKTGQELTNVEFKVGVAENIPVEDHSVDFLIFQQSFHHIENFEKAMDEMKRVLKKETGRLILLEPVHYPGESKYEFYESLNVFFKEEVERHIHSKVYRDKMIKGEEEGGGYTDFKLLKKHEIHLKRPYASFYNEKWNETMKKNFEHVHEYYNKITKEDGIELEGAPMHMHTQICVFKI